MTTLSINKTNIIARRTKWTVFFLFFSKIISTCYKAVDVLIRVTLSEATLWRKYDRSFVNINKCLRSGIKFSKVILHQRGFMTHIKFYDKNEQINFRQELLVNLLKFVCVCVFLWAMLSFYFVKTYVNRVELIIQVMIVFNLLD